ncbi:MAG: PqiA/YebS family transporter subunit [Chromatiaceae bacterium]
MTRDALTQCHECDLLQRNPVLPPGAAALCARCGALLHRNRPDSLEPTLALTLAALILFLVANSFPFLSLEMQGQVRATTLATGIINLYAEGMWGLAGVVLFTSILAPGLQLGLLLIILIPLKLGRLPARFASLFRHIRTLAPWGMMDVFMLGILVSTVKLASMAAIVPGAGLYAFGLLILVLAAAQASLDPDIVWSHLPLPERALEALRPGEATLSCPVCNLVVPVRGPFRRLGRHCCPRCGEILHRRKPRSLQHTTALIMAALILYIPANVLPIMQVTSLGRIQIDTIMSGALFLIESGMWPLALVVFIASIFVPMLKILILILLLISVRWRWTWRPRERTQLYRILELVGRWSMVDIYVVTILVALVQLGNLANVVAQPGAIFFAAVVVLTMLASMSFDPRLIWDLQAREAK